MVWILAMLMLTLPLRSAVVDRVAVSIGNRVITTSEIDERIRLTAFQNQTKPDLSATAWREAAERLVDQKLVVREMQLGRYNAMLDEDSAALLTQYSKEHYPNDQAFRKALEENRITAGQLQADLARQADLISFLNLRFRPAVQVTEEDVRKYYQTNIEPKNTPEKSLTLEEARLAIEDALTAQRADQELETWLKDQRKRTKLEYHPEAFPSATGSGAAK